MDTEPSIARRRLVSEYKVDQIFKSVWEIAARKNPMLLAKMINPDLAFEQLREMIRNSLSKGLSATDTQDYVVKELLQSPTVNTLLQHQTK